MGPLPFWAYAAAGIAGVAVARMGGGAGVPSAPSEPGPELAGAPAGSGGGGSGLWDQFGTSATWSDPTAGGVLPVPGPISDQTGGTITVTTPPPKAAFLWAVVKAGTWPTWGYGKTASGVRCAKAAGKLTTAGFTAEVRDLGTLTKCDGSGNVRLYLVLTGAHVGAVLAGNTMTVTTKYR